MENPALAIERKKTRVRKEPPHLFSWPLLKQSIKANWLLFLIVTLGMCAIITIINLVVGRNTIFTTISMDKANQYMADEGLNWIQVLGLFQTMGFGLNKLSVMANLDMIAVLNGIVYRIASVILPLLYVAIVSNNLIAAQVDDGSMAYVLSTPTNRRRVVFTQALFLFGSILAMYLVTTAFALGSEALGYMNTGKALPLRTLIMEVASYCSITALGGVAFMASCLFNRSKNSLALGGGFAVWCFLCTVLGLFGTKTFVAIGVGVPAMNVFNYLTIFTLFDADSIDTFAKFVAGQADETSLNWIYEAMALLVIAIVTTAIGMRKFEKKDLPL
jgi:ABC-type transport system involved in multi-copper enzyme maturation permease subunit